jgi:aminopeptidase N
VDEKAGVPAFVLATDVGWTINGQQDTLAVQLDKPKQTVVVAMPEEPSQVRIDPLCKVLHKLEFNPGDTMLRRQLTDAADVLGRILAAAELAKTGSRQNVQALHDAYGREPFWGGRVEIAHALAEAGTQAAIDSLAGLVASENDPMVLESLIRAAGRFRDAGMRRAVEERLGRGLPYRATQAAYEALGAQREDAPFELLAEAAARDGFGGLAQAGALRALAATRRGEAIPLLLERVGYGATSNRARPAAVGALADIGKNAEKTIRERIVERLIDLLRDPNARVRNTAVAALQTVRASEAVSALESFRAPLPAQEQVRVERAIQAMQGGDDPKVSALEKQVEELRDQLRKLQDTVQHLEARGEAGNGSPSGG